MCNDLKHGLRSKTAWACLISLVLFVAKTYYKVEIPQADALTDLILVTASAFGIFKSYNGGEGNGNN